MNRPTALRLTLVTILLATAYALALWQPVRALYGHGDKFAHGVGFIVVYAALAWALQEWRVWALVLLAAVLGALSEVHQYFLAGFTPSMTDWFADVAGIGLATGLHMKVKAGFKSPL